MDTILSNLTWQLLLLMLGIVPFSPETGAYKTHTPRASVFDHIICIHEVHVPKVGVINRHGKYTIYRHGD